MKTVSFPSGDVVPALGMGTWFIGDDPRKRQDEITCLQAGIDLGMQLIDTAEMYGEGAAESVVGAAIKGRRDKVFLVSKVYPHNASRRGAIEACERSLARLGTDHLDLYLLHWRGNYPLRDTVAAFEQLQRDGKIRHWGVSNFDTDDMEELCRQPGGENVATNQVLYNLARRGIEWDLQPWCREPGIPIMAYSPIEQARLLRNPELRALAASRDMTAAQLALAWLLHQDQVIAIPKTSTRAHLEENVAALQLKLDDEILAALDDLFPAPEKATPLEML